MSPQVERARLYVKLMALSVGFIMVLVLITNKDLFQSQNRIHQNKIRNNDSFIRKKKNLLKYLYSEDSD